MEPFESESEVIAIYGLSIENRKDRVSVFGSIDITRDMEGLENAKVLKAILEEIVGFLEKEPGLPEKITQEDVEEVDNPF